MRGEGSARRVLCVFPRYTPSFGTFEYSYPLTDGARAFMPPQGLLVIAAYLPADWEIRFIDENMRPATEPDFAWAEVVFVSGMHIQRRQMNDICRRAHAFDRPVALGGPSVSACPDYYPSFDYLHIGELGDATDQLIDRLSRDTSRPDSQVVFKTQERVEMSNFPVPAYELAEIPRYFIGSVQYSSGCPYQCDFCDIPGLYGRNPRLKTPAQVVAELDKLVACGIGDAIYFVDDNFIGNRKAALDLLPHLIAWQQRQGYRIRLACEATLNIAKRPEILSLMREAYFVTIFCGIETPNPEALKAISKDHNMMVPILDAIKTLNGFGMEVVSGIILGLDTDTPETGRHLIDFIEQSKIPLLTINLLQALPKTPLWDRLAREGRLIEDDRAGLQRPVPTAVRTRGHELAQLHEGRLPARQGLRALQPSGRAHIPEPAEAARRARVHSRRHPAGLADVGAGHLDRRRCRRLQMGLLAVRACAPRSRRSRGPSHCGPDFAPSDRLLARSLDRTAERLELLDAVA